MARQKTTPAFEIGQSIVETQVIHPCALVNAGVPGDVRGWNTNICARLMSGDGPATASPATSRPGTTRPVASGFEEVGLSLLIFLLLNY